jgi:phage terminase small subunit
MRGRKAKPTVLKLVQGNPGKRALNKDEPRPSAGAVKPRFLRGRAAVIWDEYVPELERLGLLRSVDAPMFATWCQLVAEFQRSPRGMTASRISQMRGLAAAFGMEPSARSRLSVKQDDGSNEADPAAKYFSAG